MAQSQGPGVRSARKRRRLFVAVVAIAVVGVGGLLSLAFLPFGSASLELQVAPGATTIAPISVPHAGWVTVHFDHPSAMGMTMHYWMQGTGGMMFDHPMMGGADSYSFWSWGGTYQCGVAYSGDYHGMMPVWLNTTWGLL